MYLPLGDITTVNHLQHICYAHFLSTLMHLHFCQWGGHIHVGPWPITMLSNLSTPMLACAFLPKQVNICTAFCIIWLIRPNCKFPAITFEACSLLPKTLKVPCTFTMAGEWLIKIPWWEQTNCNSNIMRVVQ